MPQKSGKILIIDDEPKVREIISAYLKREGFEVLQAGNGSEGLIAVRENPDVIILDLMLPDMDGEDICRIIRGDSNIPIIMLTAKTVVEDRVKGLLMGADDYVSKPFSPKELVARVVAVMRRARSDKTVRLSFMDGWLKIDRKNSEVYISDRRVVLTQAEFRLLLALAQRPGEVLSRVALLNLAFGYNSESYDRTIDVHIKNLRKAIERDPAQPELIRTIYGVGYKFTGVSDEE